MAKGKNWFVELDFDADPERDREEAFALLRDWYDTTRGFVRIQANTVEVSDLDEVMELKLRLHANMIGLRKVRA